MLAEGKTVSLHAPGELCKYRKKEVPLSFRIIHPANPVILSMILVETFSFDDNLFQEQEVYVNV